MALDLHIASHDFAQALRLERDAFIAFAATLGEERSSLIENDVDSLFRITQRKSENIDRLTALGEARTAWLQRLGFDGNADGIAAWLDAQQDREAAQLKQLWSEVVAAAAEARSMNEANGALITTRLSHNQAAIATLQSAARTSTLYGPSGHSDLPSGQRERGRA